MSVTASSHFKLWLLLLALAMATTLAFFLFSTDAPFIITLLGSPTRNLQRCDYTNGRWVFKNGSMPLYSGSTCKRWLSKMWACRDMRGRTDFDYEKFRWQPYGCNLPIFSSSDFLLRMKNRVVAFVGDSLGREQFQSLMCMLTGGNDEAQVEDVSESYGLVKPPGAKRAEGTAQRFTETNTTILFYWSVTLCELQPLDPSNRSAGFAMHLDKPATFLQKYLKEMHFLVLNTGQHWNAQKLASNKWVMYADNKPITTEQGFLENMDAARNFTLHKILSWLNNKKQENATKAHVFLRTISPIHFHGGQWNSGGRCDSASNPSKINMTGRAKLDPVMESVVSVAKAQVLNITYISQFRDEAHISKYMPKQQIGQDCLHWCLPGVPDVWNEIFYAEIVWSAMKENTP